MKWSISNYKEHSDLIGDRGEQHLASECPLTEGGPSDEPCEVLISGETVEVYDSDGERVA